MSLFIDLLTRELLTGGPAVSTATLAKLERHWQLVQEANKKFNLTAIRDEQAAEKHYFDCLLLLPELDASPRGGALADVGSGGGFPGLVLACCRPQLPVTLIEATEKKCQFLRDCCAELGLDNVQVRWLRAEQAGRDPQLRGQFQLVTARALAALPVLAEYCLPLLQPGGVLLAMKGPDWRAEAQAASFALSQLNGALLPTSEYALPGGDQRALVRVELTALVSDKYPRRPGLPSKHPL